MVNAQGNSAAVPGFPQILAPGGSNLWWVANSSNNEIVWDCRDSQVPSYTIILQNPNETVLAAERTLSANVSNSGCSITLPLDLAALPIAAEYNLLFTGRLDGVAELIGATTDPFEVKPAGFALPSVSLSSILNSVTAGSVTDTSLVVDAPTSSRGSSTSAMSLPTPTAMVTVPSSSSDGITHISNVPASGLNPIPTNNQTAPHHPFLQNTPAVAGTFTGVGLILAAIIMFSWKIIQARRRIRSGDGTTSTQGQGQSNQIGEITPYPNLVIPSDQGAEIYELGRRVHEYLTQTRRISSSRMSTFAVTDSQLETQSQGLPQLPPGYAESLPSYRSNLNGVAISEVLSQVLNAAPPSRIPPRGEPEKSVN
ncbi:hypothetical protein SCHPADRAFT_935181 [Schizopora paradoxa]|uniref:Uncharacterized protein n=1 Tax=Schizopora paradoxa TaxID=27342 RepID=A0A0H2S642_9AGAM|nr:hypothetical protein SCHPADRAFT_935181 [Schizopora paradoxa]